MIFRSAGHRHSRHGLVYLIFRLEWKGDADSNVRLIITAINVNLLVSTAAILLLAPGRRGESARISGFHQ